MLHSFTSAEKNFGIRCTLSNWKEEAVEALIFSTSSRFILPRRERPASRDTKMGRCRSCARLRNLSRGITSSEQSLHRSTEMRKAICRYSCCFLTSIGMGFFLVVIPHTGGFHLRTCNETMLCDKLRVFVSRISPPLVVLGTELRG